MVNDSEDCSGVISSTPVTELFTVFSPREWLFGIWTNVNCESALTHQIPRISSSDPAPLNILHSTKAKPRTPKYKEASYITGISMCQKATPTYPGKLIDTMQSEGQPGLIARKGQVGDWLTGVSCQDPAAIKSATELYM